jgi:hypothetical protein
VKSIKTMGLVVFTALALVALPSVASATPTGFLVVAPGEQPALFHSEAYPATIKGTQFAPTIEGEKVTKITFSTAAGKVKCVSATFSTPSPYLQQEDTSELFLSPATSECYLNGVSSVTVTPAESCWYVFKVVKGSFPYKGSAFVCSTKFTVAGSGCTITMQPQTRSGMQYTPVGPGTPTVEAVVNLTGVEYEIQGSCPNSPAEGLHADGTYKGGIRLSANI